jgi:hypothetical protein
MAPHCSGQLVPVDRDGTPIIMQGYRSPRMTRDGPTSQGADAARRSSGEDPARQQHLHSAAQPVAVFREQPAGCGADPARPQPYKPPPITTFSDRVNNAIQAYPLEKGIGNNPIDQQQFIRQRLNQP